MTDQSALALKLVRRLCEDWPRLDRESFRELLADNCNYVDVPFPDRLSVGPDAAFAKLGGLRTEWDITNTVRSIASDGAHVLAERTELFHHRPGKAADFSLPCVGVFTVEQGKITSWRDYWNLADAEPLLSYVAAQSAAKK